MICWLRTKKQLRKVARFYKSLPCKGKFMHPTATPATTLQTSGVPNDGFLRLNTLKTLFRLSRVLNRYLEMHSKRRYKICICSVILGELKSFRNYKGFSIIFPKLFDAIERFTKEWELFLFLSLNYNAYSSSVFTPSLLVDVVFASFCGMLEIASEDSASKMIHCINSYKFDRKII